MGIGFPIVADRLLGDQKRRRMLAMKRQGGFSMLELAIGIAIVSVLAMSAMPSFSVWIQNSRTRAAAESVQDGLQTARNEAVRRNSKVRFALTDPNGQVAWTVGCVVVKPDCPAVIQMRSGAEGGSNAHAGVSTDAAPSALPANYYGTPLAAGAGLGSGAGVTFNGLGAVPAENVGGDITRVDVINAGGGARRLVIAIGSGGTIRMCDPALSLDTNPQGCSR
jgi:type IV fimbrial biogenesis protein FimT